MADATKYNGWTNYATWGVALVIDNDEPLYNMAREKATSLKAEAAEHPNVQSGIWTEDEAVRFDLADWVKDTAEEACGMEGDHLSLMARQVIQAGLSDVDWQEIADHYVEES